MQRQDIVERLFKEYFHGEIIAFNNKDRNKNMFII